ncbi:hypothetical protein G6F59_015936 [Rhizopus arrhizus]|nr:hypothetical protein G6F59_015936 [Rhizopus arrhizus]
MRAAASVAPPGGNGTTLRTGCAGQAWAWAGPAASASTAPPPPAAPSMAAMVTCGSSLQARHNASPRANARCVIKGSSWFQSAGSFRSMPALKTAGVPVSTTARTAFSRSACDNASSNAVVRAVFSALCFSGRFRRSRRTAPWFSTISSGMAQILLNSDQAFD